MSALGLSASWVKPEVIEEKAEELRGHAAWNGIPVDPFAIASRLGIKVLVGSFADDAVEGVLRTFKGQTQILVRIASNLVRQKFTVAHELGHFALHLPYVSSPREDGEIFVDNSIQLYRKSSRPRTDPSEQRREFQANRFAAALLMPAEEVKHRANSGLSVLALAKEFGVSEQSMTYRMGQLDVW